MSKDYLGHKYVGYEPNYIESLVKDRGIEIKKVYIFGSSPVAKIFFYLDYFLLRLVPVASAAFFFLFYPVIVFDMERFKSNNPVGYVLVLRKC